MDLQASKIELAKLVLNIESEELINKVKAVLQSEPKDFYDELTDAEKAEIDLGIKQLNNGERHAWEDVYKDLLK